MATKIKVAGVQVAATADVKHNLERALETAEMAVENGARIICFAEMFCLPWFPSKIDKKAFALAQPLSGELITETRKRAKKWNTALIVPFFEDAQNGTYFNSTAVIDETGDILGVYRKMHIPQVPGWEEKSYFAPGSNGFPVFSTKGITFGIQICWDNFFPEGARILALSGAKLIFAPTANTASNEDLWQQAIRNNAFTNGCYVMRVNRVGKEEEHVFAGGSFCAAPTGDLLEDPMGEVEGLNLWPIDLGAVDFVRREWPFLRDRRPSQYLKLAGVKIVKTTEPKIEAPDSEDEREE